jgi:uncharacterized damage-inducible protein DinB
MSQELHATIVDGLVARYTELAATISSLADPLTEDQFWQKPFSFGNSFGHLVLHLTGNLNYYIGAEIGGTGYIRDRDREFAEPKRIPKAEAMKAFRDAIAMVTRTAQAQSPEDWTKRYTAVREETAGNRFNIFLRCATHLHHHAGQMNYLCFELAGEKTTGL